MLRNTFFGLFAVLALAIPSQAAVLGSFRLIEAGRTTNALVHPDPFDIWAFDLVTPDGDITALELEFNGAFLNTAGNVAFRNEAQNPLVFGFEAPETFFVLPPAASQLATGTADTNAQLKSAFTTEGAVTLVPGTNTATPVAFFSVAPGTQLTFANNVADGALALIGGVEIAIEAGGAVIPEPSTIALLGLAMVGFVGLRRRS